MAQGNYQKEFCRITNEKRFDFVKKNPSIKKVYLVARWALYTNDEVKPTNKKYYLINAQHKQISLDESIKVFKESFFETINRYESIGVKVFVLLQPPELQVSPELIYSRIRQNINFTEQEKRQYIETFSIEKNKHNDIQKVNREVINSFKNNLTLTIIDVDNLFCGEIKCFIGDSNHSMYQDKNHVNNYGARKIVLELFK